MKKVGNTIVVGMLFILIACKKDKSDSQRVDLISTGTWKLFGLTAQPGYDVDGDGYIDNNLYLFYDACEKDNIHTFRKNGEYQIDEGASKCDPADPQVYSSHWEFRNGESEIMIDGDLGVIEELTSTSLRIRGQIPGQAITFTFGR
jgi:hypothetical protein